MSNHVENVLTLDDSLLSTSPRDLCNSVECVVGWQGDDCEDDDENINVAFLEAIGDGSLNDAFQEVKY